MSKFKKYLFDQRHVWWPAVKRGFKKAMLYTGITIGSFVLLAIVFWDADFYVARDRWETFKHAIFGEWQGGAVATVDAEPPVLDIGKQVEVLFSGYGSVHLFTTMKIEGTTSFVDTGARFESVADILSASPQQQWCEVENQENAVNHRTQIAQKIGSSSITKNNVSSVTTAELELLGINRGAFITLPNTHCQFDFFIKE